MKLATSTTLLQSAGVKQRAQARVNMNATAFKILSSGLYADKIAAVLREIGCNAADAHVMAGTPDRPFEVKLPSALDPTFSIRDFGPGLSHEDVMTNYQTYFHSTKTDSNDVTGCFGLGSKSPYAYTDQFTVKSAHDGILRVYFCAFDETGVPTTSLVSESPVTDDWPHGLEVQVPVKYGDMSAFASTAQEVYQWFRIPPIVRGATLLPVEYEWVIGRFRCKTGRGWGATPRLIMGNVSYKLDASVLRTNAESAGEPSWLVSAIDWIWRADVIVEVPIGSVDITASRETVEYTPHTIAALNDLIKEEVRGYADKLVAFFDSIPKVTTATVSEAFEQLGANLDAKAIEYLGDSIVELLPPQYEAAFSAMRGQAIELEGWDTLCETKRNAQVAVPAAKFWSWDGNRRCSAYFYGLVTAGPRETILVNDNPKRASDRVRQYMMDNRGKRVLLFSSMEPEAWKEIVALLDNNSVQIVHTLVSSLPVPLGKLRSGTGGARCKPEEREIPVWDTTTPVSNINDCGFNPPATEIQDVPDDSRYYVVREAGGWGKRWLVTHSSRRESSARAYFRSLAALQNQGLPIPSHIAVVTPSMVPRFKLESFGFKPLSDWVENVLMKDQRVTDHCTSIAERHNIRACFWSGAKVSMKLLGVLVGADDSFDPAAVRDSLAGTAYLDELEAAAADYLAVKAKADSANTDDDGDSPLGAALIQFGIDRADTNWITHNFDAQMAQLEDKYPLLGLIYPASNEQHRAFHLQLIAMAVSQSEISTSTAEEN